MSAESNAGIETRRIRHHSLRPRHVLTAISAMPTDVFDLRNPNQPMPAALPRALFYCVTIGQYTRDVTQRQTTRMQHHGEMENQIGGFA